MTDAEIGKPRRVVRADRDVAHPINHPIVDAVIPPQRGLRVEIAEAIACVFDGALPGGRYSPRSGREGATESRNAAAGRTGEADGELAAENWSRKHVGRSGKNKIRNSFQSEVEVHIH